MIAKKSSTSNGVWTAVLFKDSIVKIIVWNAQTIGYL